MEDILPGMIEAPNLHPIFVHFPVALLPAVLLFWFLAIVCDRDDFFRVGRWLLWLGLAGALLAVVTGLDAEERLGHEAPGHELIHVHRNWMLVAAGLALGVAALAQVAPERKWLLTFALAFAVGVLILGADRGARLVFGRGVGTRRPPAAVPHEPHEHRPP